MQDDLTRGLNPPQREAVVAGGGPLLIIAGPGSGKCVLPATRMVVNDELITTEEVWSRYHTSESWDGEGWVSAPTTPLWVDSFDEGTGQFRPAPITAVYRQHVSEPVRVITFRDGSRISVTMAHRFFDGSRWTNDVHAGDILALPGRLSAREQPIDPDLAELLGWLIGEGYERTMRESIREFSITLKDYGRLERLRRIIVGLMERYRLGSRKLAIKPITGRTTHRLTFWSTPFYRLLLDRGYVFGQRAAQKRVPGCIMRAHNEGVAIFLRALFDGEGWVERHRVQVGLTTASPHLAEEVRHLLRRFGIWTRLSRRDKAATNGSRTRRPYWTLYIGGPSLRTFADRIGFSDPAKAALLRECISRPCSPNRDLLPSEAVVKHMAATTMLSPKRLVAYTGQAKGYARLKRFSRTAYRDKIRPALVDLCARQGERLTGNQFRPMRVLTTDDVAHVRQGIATLDRLATAALFYEQVQSVEEVDYCGWVYDFSVEETHNFVAESVLCHNTRVLTHRIAHLVRQDVPPWRICAVTFTNKAAREMRDRLERLIGDQVRDLAIGTFHALSARFLRQFGQEIGLSRDFTIYDDEDQLTLVRQVLKDLELDPKQVTPRSMLSGISAAKSAGRSPAEQARQGQDYRDELVARVYAGYQALLDHNQALDFDDLLLRLVDLLSLPGGEAAAKLPARFLHVLVDEYQDTNEVQFEIVRRLSSTHGNICVVGDPDQSIYAWRGATIKNILEFELVFPEARVITLEQNYRSSRRILRAADAVIAHNRERKEKQLWTENGEGERVIIRELADEHHEADWVVREIQRLIDREGYRASDIAILYRTNTQSQPIEQRCVRYNLSYQLIGGTRFYERKEIKDVLALLRVLVNHHDDVSLRRVVEAMPLGEGLGSRTWLRLESWAREAGMGVAAALAGWVTPTAGPVPPLTGAAARAARRLAEGLTALRQLVGGVDLVTLFDQALDQSGYLRVLREGTEPERLENVEQLRSEMARYVTLPLDAQLIVFLEETSLVAAVDELPDTIEKVTLITLHAAKGLEFPVVFMIGMEEGLLPHARSLTSQRGLEEERRLAFVGMTRARQRLYLTYAYLRRNYTGQPVPSTRSSFLDPVEPEAQVEASVRGPRPMPSGPPSGQRGPAAWSSRSPVAGGRGLPPARQPAPARPAPEDFSDEPEIVVAVRAGDRVRHPTLGVGVVRRVLPTRGDVEVTVEFDEQGTRRLLASYAHLTRC